MFGLIKKYNVHMCSEVKGIVTLHGEPVEGALIKRNLHFAYKVEKEDQVTTASDGSFYLPEVVIESKIPGDMFSHEVTYQLITAFYKEQTYVLWSCDLKSIKEPDEYKKKLYSLNGDLSLSKVKFTFPNHKNTHLYFYGSTICRWDNDFEIYVIEEEQEDLFKDFR